MALNTIADLSTTAGSNVDILGQNATGSGSANTIDTLLQNLMALMARAYGDQGGLGTVGGSANAITLTSLSTYQSLASGLTLAFKAASANTGATTLNLDGLGAKAVRRQGDSALSANDIVANGRYLVQYDAAYNGAAGAWVLLNPDINRGALETYFDTQYAAATAPTLCAFFPTDNEPPSSNYAVFGTRNGHPYLAFDTATQWTAIFTGVLPREYAGGGVTVYVHVMMASATTGTVGFDVAFERIDASSLDLDADSFAAANTITATTVPSTSGQILSLSVAFTSGAQMDSLAAGEPFRLRLRRDVANDTATGDAQVIAVEVKAT